MVWRSALLDFTALLLSSLTVVYAQTISSTTSVPPLQWINLSSLLHGSPQPPPLKDASIGYDETSRSLIIFGGESEGGFVQSQTYLLNLDTLTWSAPSPPANLQRAPSARSAAVGGGDFAASNRHGFVIIGGKGSGGVGLSDVWEYDFINQFWSEVGLSPGGPSARWGATGGIDIRTMPLQDPVVPGPNNTFYLAGGFDGTTSSSLSDIWRLNISGTLSSNLPNNSTGSWDRLTIGKLPSKVDQAGTIVSRQIISAGGCNTTLPNDNCPQQDSYVIDTQGRSEISPPACIAPRSRPSLVPNANTFSSSFTSQVFLLLGTFNTSLWQDDGGLEKGEVCVLDINTGSWSRILPAGDPGTSGKPTFPSPRRGATAFSYHLALVGQSRPSASDTIIFGGEDASGKYLSEVWILRAYAGTISASNPAWSGFGNGQLQSGPTANGAGVTNRFITTCVTAVINPNSPSVTTTPSASASNSTTPGSFYAFDASVVHKLLAPLSLALLFPAVLLFRLASPSFTFKHDAVRHAVLTYLFVVLAIASYGSGIAGIATSFTTVSSTLSVAKRSPPSMSNITLKTSHGKAGLALFIGLYALVPLLVVLSLCFRRCRDPPEDDKSERDEESSEHTNSADSSEDFECQGGPDGNTSRSIITPSPPPPRPRIHSWSPSSLWQRKKEGRLSSASEIVRPASPSASPPRGFEVLNRPSRPRLPSGGWEESRHAESRNLGDTDWLQRRRSLNAVDELDYAITQANRTHVPSTPSTADALMTPALTPTPVQTSTKSHPQIHSLDIIPSCLFHIFLLGLCILSLLALWSRAPPATFAVFLTWTLAFYIIMFVFAWNGRPENSTLTLIINRLWGGSNRTLDPSTSHSPRPSPVADDTIPFPTQGPYVHQPPYRAVDRDDAYHPRAPQSVATDDDVEDEDEHTRQRRMEEEMGRREVSIITVPKRKLWIANPS